MRNFLLFFLIISAPVWGQITDQQYLAEYKAAVSEFKAGRFESSFGTFERLTSYNAKNPIVPYAYLYGAMAAEESGKRYQSKLLFRSLFQNHENWEKINDARMLYAKQNFEDGYFEEGMKAVHQISNPDFDEQKNNLIANYIENVRTITSLKNLYNKYPNYKPIAEALVIKIQNNRYNTKADLELSDLLTNRFKLNKAPSNPNNPGSFVSKDLNFGLLLPFNAQPDKTPESSSRYVYDIYQGMLLAAEKLSEEGVSLKIHSYDVRNSAASYKNAETKEGFKYLDLIVGPLYATPNNLANKLISDNKTIQVHPISNNVSLVENSATSYLFQPSFKQQATKALEYLETITFRSGSKTLNIYYGSSSKDLQFAKTYAEVAKAKGFEVSAMKKYAEREKIDGSVGHIFFVGDNNLGSEFIKDLDISLVNCEVLITANSFNWYNIDPSIFKSNISIIYPEFIDINKESVKEFERLYYSKMQSFPSYYSYLGYDLAYYFANKLESGKDAFETGLRLNLHNQGTLLSGFDYSDGSRQNNIVPIVKFIDNRLEEVSR